MTQGRKRLARRKQRASIVPARTSSEADPMRFWTFAAALGGQLANEGMERTSDPLLWVAALEMAQEAVLNAGGGDMLEDWGKAMKGRKKLAKQGVTFGIEQEGSEPDGQA